MIKGELLVIKDLFEHLLYTSMWLFIIIGFLAMLYLFLTEGGL